MIESIIAFLQKLKIINKSKIDNIFTTKPIQNPKSTVILMPVASHIEPSVDDALRKLENMGYTVWRKYGFSAIDQGRCVIAQEALDAGFEHLFWIDSDV